MSEVETVFITAYIPGVCNIGPNEVSLRKRSGWVGVAASTILFLLFILLDVPAIYRLIVFFPATMAAIGFLQAYFHFCAGFGFKGVYNVLKPVGQTETVEQSEFQRKDRQKALQITGLAVIIGLIFTVIIY